MAKSLKNLESLIEGGENPNGFTSQTSNGTAHWRGMGWNYLPPFEMPQEGPHPGTPWPGGRSNRTGE